MANEYFDWSGNPGRFVFADVVRSEDANTMGDEIEVGFDALPDPNSLWGSSFNYAAAAGSVDAWSATIAAAYLDTLVTGMQIRVKFAAANTVTTPTFNLNGLGAKTMVRMDGTALAAGDITANSIVTLTYSSAGSGTWQVNTMATTTQAQAAAAAAAASEAAASASAAAAAASAAGVSFVGTSATSVAIATGSKSFTASTARQWGVGQFLVAASAANPANYMHGQVTAYNSGTGALTINVGKIGGSGTLADWNITVSGPQGETGNTGADGMSIVAKYTGTITIAGGASSNTATITAVDTANSILTLLGTRSEADASFGAESTDVTLVLTNSTTITAARNATSGGNLIVAYQLIEYA